MATALEEIQGIGPANLTKLKEAGVKDIESLATATVDELVEAGISEASSKKFIKRAQRDAVLIQSASQRQAMYDSRTMVTSGIDELDNMIGGGFAEGSIVAIYGGSGSGKTQLTFNCIVNAVKETGLPAVYIETEKHRFSPRRLKQLAGEDDDFVDSMIHVIPAYSLDQQMNAYHKIMSEFDKLAIVAVDSFTARFRMAEQFEGRGNFSERSQVFKRHLIALEELGEICECPIILPCQIYQNPGGYGASEQIYGATIFVHMASYMIRCKKSTGDMRKLMLENHPEYADDEIYIRIMDEGILGMRK